MVDRFYKWCFLRWTRLLLWDCDYAISSVRHAIESHRTELDERLARRARLELDLIQMEANE